MSLVNLEASEKKISSQNGEDGVIEAIFAEIGETNRYFVEFGVEGAVECNTAQLLVRGWQGLMMDYTGVSKNPLADVKKEFITAENINDLFRKYDVPQQFDLCSIDIDGNDWYVWKALEYRPRVMVMEYNSHVPPHLCRSIKYEPMFQWHGTDYFGASLLALQRLGELKGYTLIYCESNGANAFFLANEELPAGFVPRPIEQIYRRPNYFGQGYGFRRDPHLLMVDPFAETSGW